MIQRSCLGFATALIALVLGGQGSAFAASAAERSDPRALEGPAPAQGALDPELLDQHLEDLERFLERRFPALRWAAAGHLLAEDLDREVRRFQSHLRRVEARVAARALQGADPVWIGDALNELRALGERVADLASADLGSVDLGSVDLGSVDLGSVDLGSVDLEPAAIASGEAVESLDLPLGHLGAISGRVTTSTGEPIPFVDVFAVLANGLPAGVVTTDDSGEYRLDGLEPVYHYLYTSNVAGFVDEVYDKIPCRRACEPLSGVPIPVDAGRVTSGIDFALEPGGVVTGTVTETLTGDPIPEVTVTVLVDGGFFVASATTDAEGRYEVPGLAFWGYRVTAILRQSPGYVPELYDDIPCYEGSPTNYYACDVSPGDSVIVRVGQTTPGIDFALDRLGSISGALIDRVTGAPVTAASIRVHRANGFRVDVLGVDEDGRYESIDRLPGSYFVHAVTSGWVSELYDDIPCPLFDGNQYCEVEIGTPVAVEANADTSGIDFVLEPFGSISGTVRATTTGAPVASISVAAYHPDGTLASGGSTGGDGRYTIPHLLAGSYYVVATSGDVAFREELYDDIPCRRATCDLTTGVLISVAAGADTPGIDFDLLRLGILEGTVRDSVAGQPVSTRVRVWNTDGDVVAGVPLTETDADGQYSVRGLPPGTYFVTTFNRDEYRDELYDDLPFDVGEDPTVGTPVRVGEEETVRGVDFVLDLERGVVGRVVHDPSGRPLTEVRVQVWDALTEELVKTVVTNPEGVYAASLRPGVYYVSTDASERFPEILNEVYNDVPCEPGCDVTQGEFVWVRHESSVPLEVDFALAGRLCLPSGDRLCLNRDRFEVRAAWRDFEGASGPGTAEALTGDTGTFWFFGPENIELVVKVLDACVEPFHSFWVFATGLTNVETTLTVTDTWTGEVQEYFNPLGCRFHRSRIPPPFEPARSPSRDGLFTRIDRV